MFADAPLFSGLLILSVFVAAIILGFADTAALADQRPASTATDPTAITGVDLLRFRTVTDIEIAQDGSFAIYTVKSIHKKFDAKKKPTGEYEYRTHLWRIDLTNPKASPSQLTFGKRTASDPAISPDGTRLAFTRTEETDDDKAEKKSQVWLLPLNQPGEANALTNLEDGASNPVWHPSGTKLLVTSRIPYSKIEGLPDWNIERPGLSIEQLIHLKSATNPNNDKNKGEADDANEINKTDKSSLPANDLQSVRNWLNQNATDETKPNPDLVTRRSFLDEHNLAKEMKFAHLFLLDLETLTDENDDETAFSVATKLTDGFHNYGDPQFSPDGSTIAFSDKPRGPEHPDRYLRTYIYLMNVDGSDIHKLAGDDSRTFSQPRFLPDGTAVLATTVPTEEMWYQQEDLARIILNSTDGSFEILTQDWPSYAGLLQIDSQTGRIFFNTAWHGTFPLREVGIDAKHIGRTHEIEISENAGVETFDVENNTIVAAVTSVDHPMRLITMNADGKNTRLLHDLNPWVAQRTISHPEEHSLTQPDGTEIQYWIMPPSSSAHDSNKNAIAKTPTVLEIHGGPSAMWGPGERTMWLEYQLLCAWGYGIVYANPRGSGGYGYEFQRANHQNWGEGPSGDVLAALDEAASIDQWIDTENLFVTGGSYAGYLTAWIVSHDHRFNAAVAQRGVYDLNTFFGEGNAWILVPWAMGGYPWNDATQEILKRESPFTYVDQIETPLMIIHASTDLRTGVTQSEMMYRALKELKRPVEYVRYPDAGHDLSRTGDPKQRVDRLLRIVEFFERYRK